VASLLTAIRALGLFDDEDIIICELSVDVEYGTGIKREVVGYTYRRNFAVKLRDVTKFDLVLNVILTHGSNRISSIDFRSTNIGVYHEQALKHAINTAVTEAYIITTELDLGVGPVISIVETTNNAEVAYRGIAPYTGLLTPLGQLEVKATVLITFELTRPVVVPPPPTQGPFPAFGRAAPAV